MFVLRMLISGELALIWVGDCGPYAEPSGGSLDHESETMVASTKEGMMRTQG
jgi:hypothetical protein